MLEKHIDRTSVYRIWNFSFLFSSLPISLSLSLSFSFLCSVFSLPRLSLPSHLCFSKFYRSREPTRRSRVTLYGYIYPHTRTHRYTSTSGSHFFLSFPLSLVLILRFRSNGRWIDLKTWRRADENEVLRSAFTARTFGSARSRHDGSRRAKPRCTAFCTEARLTALQ